ncbi:MAG: hypothetical protein IT178_17380, partial [Acidobacteria bacterium]|nr:hypothetical protein [Acidobacteriota bacterium]
GEDDDPQPWRIVAVERLSSVDGLHRLHLRTDQQFNAQDLSIRSIDFEIRLPAGQVFTADTIDGATALVLIGDGTMRFSPAPREERGQVRIFAGSESLDAPFTTAMIRMSPFDFKSMVADTMLVPAANVDTRLLRRAQQVFDAEIGKSFSLDLSDLSRDTWSLLPQPGDFVAEVRTRRYETLTYARSTTEPEDVSLFQRSRKRNISVYASEQKLAERGRFYNEDDLVDYDILDYEVDSTFTPAREWLDGRTRLKLRVRAFAMPAVTLKLNEALTVNSVTSDEFGRLLFLRVKNQSSIVINLPGPVPQGTELTLHLTYQGRVPRQGINDDTVAPSADQQGTGRQREFEEEMPLIQPEANWLFSSRAQWYPQGNVTDFATATLRITVPSEFTVVGSGVQAMDSPLVVDALPNGTGGRALFTFVAAQPVRYLSMVVSRMNRADAATVALDIVPPQTPVVSTNGKPAAGKATTPLVPPVGSRNTLPVTVDANRRQEGRGRDSMETIAEIVRLYASLVGDVPYDALNVAMIEDDLPGGHAPGYMAVINNPLPTSPFTWKNDPAAFPNFPEFFLAHELAHQWFGQAVGWKNYHEQWLSEGLSQYLAALYARERRGDSAFRDLLRQFRRFSHDSTEEGPISLGYRLGHIRNESRVFRALVYNKGAAVLHMLRRFVGDDAFFAGLRRYYRENRFKKAGTSDLQQAIEAESGQDLERFFERWVFDNGIPRVRYSTSRTGDDVVVRLDQGPEIYDIPVTVTIQRGDGTVLEEVLRLTEPTLEARISVPGPIRAIELNQDYGSLAIFERSR